MKYRNDGALFQAVNQTAHSITWNNVSITHIHMQNMRATKWRVTQKARLIYILNVFYETSNA